MCIYIYILFFWQPHHQKTTAITAIHCFFFSRSAPAWQAVPPPAPPEGAEACEMAKSCGLTSLFFLCCYIMNINHK